MAFKQKKFQIEIRIDNSSISLAFRPKNIILFLWLYSNIFLVYFKYFGPLHLPHETHPGRAFRPSETVT